ncbi:MAG: ADP-ribosylation factor-like protein [Promethearchaeia archaeon]
MREQIICLTYFDQIIGPNKFYCTEELKDPTEEPDLEKIMEFNDQEGTFIFAFRKYQTINHIFSIESEKARGGKELLMLSLLIKAVYFRKEIIDVFKYLESKGPILEQFAEEIKQLKELPEILHKSKSINLKNVLDIADDDFRRNFLNLIEKYKKLLYPSMEIIPVEDDLKKIFIIGAQGVGKTTFLKNVEAIQFYNQYNKSLPTKIYEIIIENLKIMTYECIETDFKCDICKNNTECLAEAQGFVFIINASDISSLKIARENLNKLINKCSIIKEDKIPVLVIGNIFKDNSKDILDPELLEEYFNFEDIKDCGIKIKYLPIEIRSDNKGIVKALRWIAKNML